MSNQKKKTVKLSSEDQNRMIRLSEEVTSRIKEMNMIINRNLGLEFKEEEELVFVGPQGRTGKWTERVGSGCYDYCQGLCCEGPCPC